MRKKEIRILESREDKELTLFHELAHAICYEMSGLIHLNEDEAFIERFGEILLDMHKTIPKL